MLHLLFAFNWGVFLLIFLFFFLLLQIAAFITAPFDVVKTHKQIEFGDKILYAKEPIKALPTVGTLSILQKIYYQNGLKGIFAGLTPRVFKVAPACAIMITSFEYGKAFFFRQNIKHYGSMLSPTL